MNITLIGMPGSGKSFVGEKLAETLGCSFFDPDKILEQAHKKSLPKILGILGEEKFLQTEADLSVAAIEREHVAVLSTGGSIIYSDDTMEKLARLSTIVYLKVDINTIKDRIGDAPRGIVGLKNKSLSQIYLERSSLYEKWAAITIDGTQDRDQIIEKIRTALKNKI